MEKSWIQTLGVSYVFNILHRVKTSPPIFFCRDCPSYLAFAETVCDLLLPAETTFHEKWLPAETVCVILLHAETLGRKLNHRDSLCRKLFTKHNSLGRKQEITEVSAEAKYDG